MIESVGALILFINWIHEMGWGKSLWYVIFHSVSAFNNAGIDLFGNSLQGFTGDWVVTITLSLLFIIGSLGFLVIYEVINYRERRQLSLHARMVLIGTGLVVALGAVMCLLVEYNHALIQLPWTEKILAVMRTWVHPAAPNGDSKKICRRNCNSPSSPISSMRGCRISKARYRSLPSVNCPMRKKRSGNWSTARCSPF